MRFYTFKRRNILNLLLFVLVGILILAAGCMPKEESSTSNDASPAENTDEVDAETSSVGTFVVDLVADATTMDPGQATDVNTHRVHYNMFDTLVQWKEEAFEIAPGLAEEWDISEDGLEYTFYLREGAMFHDGTDVDAEAVKFTYDRMIDENHEHHYGPFPLADFYYGMIEEIEVIDPYTVKFVLQEKTASFLFNMATIIGGIVSPTAVQESGEDFASNAIGSGPFKLENWQRGVQIELAPHKEYWDGAPEIAKLVITPVKEDLVRVTRLMNGESHLIYDVNPDSIEEIEGDSNLEMLTQASPHLWYVGLNIRKEPFGDLKVRQAVNYAIDKEAIVNDILKGTGVAATQPLAPAYNGHDPSIEGYPYNPEKAKQLLEEAGYSEGDISINFVIPESGSGMQQPVAMSTAIQSYLADVGIEVGIEKMEWGAFLDEVNQGGRDVNDMWALSWMAITGDDDNVMTNLYSSNNIPLFNSGYYENEEVTTLLDEARVETDFEKRSALYQKASKIITEEAAMLFVDYAKQTAAMTSELNGFQLHPSQMMDVSKIGK
ncbi:ABC transporter substrate-binding protein [Virgibacillus sp. W0430]|uniref:ABC transporter substrate-binding protein n=1 Tax=Virgibacillus sp. W0430 TaxID=3391580 RepID=UPI003F449772